MYKLTELPKLFDELLCDTRVRKATKYISEKSTIKVTRIGKANKRSNHFEFKVTIGNPNYEERLQIKRLKGANTSWPVSHIFLKYYPEKKKR